MPKLTQAQKDRDVEKLTEEQYQKYLGYPENIDHITAIMFAKTEGLVFIDSGGRCACTQHIGSYGMAALIKNPKAKRFTTPLTRWDLYVNPKWGCETCESEKRKKPSRKSSK